MPTFRRPGKQKAYEKALRFTAGYDDEFLATPHEAKARLTAAMQGEFLLLSLEDARHVAAKALQAERERRRNVGGDN